MSKDSAKRVPAQVPTMTLSWGERTIRQQSEFFGRPTREVYGPYTDNPARCPTCGAPLEFALYNNELIALPVVKNEVGISIVDICGTHCCGEVSR